jgi:hypothetical protein
MTIARVFPLIILIEIFCMGSDPPPTPTCGGICELAS